MEERLTALEVRIAHQDRLLADLDEVVRDFARRVERLEQRLAEVTVAGAPAIGPADEPPPHY